MNRHPNPLHGIDPAALRRRTSVKWRHYPPDVLPLWVAEMDTSPAEPVAEAIRRAVAEGDLGYSCGAGYAEAFAAFAADRWGWAIDPATTAQVPDVMMGVTELIRLLTDPGDAVVVTPPVYPPFYQFVTSADRRVVTAPLSAEHRLDLDAMDAAFAAATTGGRGAVLLLCNPHNPTGTVHTATELAAVADLAEGHGVRVVSDEIHAPLALPGSTVTPYLSVPGAERGMAVVSASKAWNLAGLKAAVAVPGPEAVADLAMLPEEVGHGVSHLAVIAHTAALTGAVDWLDALLAGLAENWTTLTEALTAALPLVGVRRAGATYFAWLDCTALGLGEDPAATFLDRGRVALNSGPTFGTGGAGHVRMNLATSPEIVTEAVARMAAAV